VAGPAVLQLPFGESLQGATSNPSLVATLHVAYEASCNARSDALARKMCSKRGVEAV
jgi:hypothetical protein